MSISVTLDNKPLTQAVTGLKGVFNKPAVLKLIGGAVQEAILERFHASKEHFAPNAQSTIERKKGDNPLRDTGVLMNSITFKTSANSVEVGSNVEYAADAHDGGGPIPKRPYLALGKDIQETIDKAVQHHIDGALA